MTERKMTIRSTDADLRDGDLVFIAIDNFLYRRVARATKGWTSHVGIVFKESRDWVVYESTIPTARVTPLETFIDRSTAGTFAVRRLAAGLSEIDARALRREAERHLGKLYHLGFDLDSRRQFCSKLVYQSYLDAVGIEVGRVETARDLVTANPQESLTFWRLWFLGRIPWSRRVITPQSQYEDPNFYTVFEQIPNLAYGRA